MPSEWKRLVVEAKNSDIGFEKLIVKLEPILYTIARGLANNLMVEDLVQLSRIKIWQLLPKVDLGRSDTIRQYLVTAGANAMKDYLRGGKEPKNVKYTDINEAVVAAIASPTQSEMFSGLLKEYVTYIMMNSTFAGSHQFLAAKYGVSSWVMRGRFHKAAGEFLEGLQNEKGKL